MKAADKRAREALEESKVPTPTQKGQTFEGAKALANAGVSLSKAKDKEVAAKGRKMAARGILGMPDPEKRKGYKKGGLVRGCGIAKRGFGKAMKGK